MEFSFQLIKSYRARASDYTPADLRAVARFTLMREKVKGPVELTLDLTSPQRIQALNRRFRGVDRNTDVIAFRYELEPQTASVKNRRGSFNGDIAINIPQARLQAVKMRHLPKREVRLLLIHGILHLVGYTDYEPVPRRRMFKRQNQLLRQWESAGPLGRGSARA